MSIKSRWTVEKENSESGAAPREKKKSLDGRWLVQLFGFSSRYHWISFCLLVGRSDSVVLRLELRVGAAAGGAFDDGAELRFAHRPEGGAAVAGRRPHRLLPRRPAQRRPQGPVSFFLSFCGPSRSSFVFVFSPLLFAVFNFLFCSVCSPTAPPRPKGWPTT